MKNLATSEWRGENVHKAGVLIEKKFVFMVLCIRFLPLKKVVLFLNIVIVRTYIYLK